MMSTNFEDNTWLSHLRKINKKLIMLNGKNDLDQVNINRVFKAFKISIKY